MYVTLQKKKQSMVASCTFILIMEIGSWIFIVLVVVLFYLEYDRKIGKNSSY